MNAKNTQPKPADVTVAHAPEPTAKRDGVEVYLLHGYQPDWDANKEPKPDQWLKGSFQDASEELASDLVKGGHAKRVSDMSDAELGKAGYFKDAEDAAE